MNNLSHHAILNSFSLDSFNPDGEPPPQAAHEPSGDSILDETEQQLLGSFFDGMNNDQWGNLSFGEGLNFTSSWLDLPPQFVGSTTSFGQQPEVSMTSPGHQTLFNDHGATYPGLALNPQAMAPPPAPAPAPPQPQPRSQSQHYQIAQPQQLHSQHYPHAHQNSLRSFQTHNQSRHAQHSDDVLSAAATLIHNTTPRAAHQDYTQSRRQAVPPVGHLRHQPIDEFREEGLRSFQQEQGFSQDWMNPQASRNQRMARQIDYQWGSDANFSTVQGYTPEAKKETVESHHQEQLGLMECLEVNKSATNTRPSSPSLSGNRTRRVSISEPTKSRDDFETPPRKRRKSRTAKNIPEEEEEEEDRAELKAARKGKAKAENNNSNSQSVETTPKPTGKKRGSAKAPRENLTDEQKRENHIKSEQKRRTLIKEGFDDLCELVPGLQGGGFSKSTMLSMAADFLQELLEGNEELGEQLANMDLKEEE